MCNLGESIGFSSVLTVGQEFRVMFRASGGYGLAMLGERIGLVDWLVGAIQI